MTLSVVLFLKVLSYCNLVYSLRNVSFIARLFLGWYHVCSVIKIFKNITGFKSYSVLLERCLYFLALPETDCFAHSMIVTMFVQLRRAT